MPHSEMIEIPAQKNVPAYLAHPAGEIKGAIIVIHEVWGLVDHIKSIANRYAEEGYLALAPDLLIGTGVDTGAMGELQEGLFDPDRRNIIQPELRRLMAPMQNPEFGKSTAERVKACFDYLYNLPEAKQNIAVVGFCFGGSYAYSLATLEPRLKLALPFYGHADQTIEELSCIACPIRAYYGEHDEALISGISELSEKMTAAEVDFESKIYPDCGHAFFNDTNSFAYNQAAAQDAWQETLSLLTKHLN